MVGDLDDYLDRKIMDFMDRLISVRSHFVGLLCFWSLCMLSVPFWKATLIAFFATSFMVLRVEPRFTALAVLVLTIAGSAAFVGISIHDVTRLAIDLHLATG